MGGESAATGCPRRPRTGGEMRLERIGHSGEQNRRLSGYILAPRSAHSWPGKRETETWPRSVGRPVSTKRKIWGVGQIPTLKKRPPVFTGGLFVLAAPKFSLDRVSTRRRLRL